MTSEMAIEQIKDMQKRLDECKKWNLARSMVLDYLRKHYGLQDPLMWAYKTIEIFEEHRKLKG